MYQLMCHHYLASKGALEQVSEVFAEEMSAVELDVLSQIRSILLAEVAEQSDLTVLVQLIDRIQRNEVSKTLQILSEATSGFSSKPIENSVRERISYQYPAIVQQWGLTLDAWTFGTALIVAGSLGENSFWDLFNYSKGMDSQPLLILAYHHNQIEKGRLAWYEEIADQLPEIIVSLIGDPVSREPEASHVLSHWLSSLSPTIELPTSDDLLARLHLYSEASFGGTLRDLLFSRLMRQYMVQAIDLETYEHWINTSQGAMWLQSISRQKLFSLLSEAPSTSAGSGRIWQAIESGSNVLVKRGRWIIHELIAQILQSDYSKTITEDIAASWVGILEQAKLHGSSKLYFGLCGQALEFALGHLTFPVSELVVVSFETIYKAYMQDQVRSPSLFNFLNFFSGWDKAKHLRREVVSAFIASQWPPEDLALAMPDRETFRKIFKRVLEYSNGRIYINKMLAGLQNREDHKGQQMYDALEEMIQSPDFDEPWI